MGPKRNMIRPVGDQYGGSKGQYGAVETNYGVCRDQCKLVDRPIWVNIGTEGTNMGSVGTQRRSVETYGGCRD